MDADPSSENRLDDRLLQRCEEIPEDPPAGNYVVVDVIFFSTTVVELLANGASRVHVTEERGNEFDYREDNPETKIGGERTDGFEPAEGYDFYNSPSYVQQLDLDGRPASFWSTNGGRALIRLRNKDRNDVHIYVGSTSNARALGEHLRETGRPTYLVSAGSKGDVATEDLIGSTLISRYLDGIPPARAELDLFREQVTYAKGADYIDAHPIRRRDVCDYSADFNARGVIPKLREESLIDLARDEPLAERQGAAAD